MDHRCCEHICGKPKEARSWSTKCSTSMATIVYQLVTLFVDFCSTLGSQSEHKPTINNIPPGRQSSHHLLFYYQPNFWHDYTWSSSTFPSRNGTGRLVLLNKFPDTNTSNWDSFIFQFLLDRRSFKSCEIVLQDPLLDVSRQHHFSEC